MMLAVILFLCGVTTISSVPVEPTGEVVTCETIMMGADLLSLAKEAMGKFCCQGEDCPRVENEDCRAFAQEQLQPCLLDSEDGDCAIEAMKSLYPTPECPDVANICQALDESRQSLEDTAYMVCPETGPRPRFIFGFIDKMITGVFGFFTRAFGGLIGG